MISLNKFILSRFLYFVLAILLFSPFSSCNNTSKNKAILEKEIGINNIQIYNGSKDSLLAILDQDTMRLLPYSSIEKYGMKGKHSFVSGKIKTDFQLKKKEKVIINVNKDTLIKSEILYSTDRSIYRTAKPEDYSSPYKIIYLDGEKYLGANEFLVDVDIIKGWDFGLNTQLPRHINSESELFKGSILEVKQSYFKIYTLDEFKKNERSLNRTDAWIAPVFRRNVQELLPKYQLDVKQNHWAIIIFPDGQEISIGKVILDAKEDLEFFELNFYNKEKHGTITQIVGKILSCTIRNKEGTLKTNQRLEIVLSDGHHQPHVRPMD